ncbi:unnamed protein product [Acanthoscelides obtectus]|uniref:Uncharacterized protein n=1 Tax=Acanthoscelides obtectus TaxID=200917 RepID=A0A9P0JHY5_ACAOB|nr:unnamed protein product [Acanthoscelides obtectus]CAK1624925.1 hypothetical protein AOBTE_LOCUS2853 [Acanthoscelides obtectus]
MGISMRTVSRIFRESKENRKPVDQEDQAASKTKKYKPREKTKTADLPDAVKMEVKNAIYNMYSEKRHVTIKTLKEELDVKQIVDISKMSLCCLLPLIGFQYKQEDNRKALMEKSSVVALRAEFLRKYNENGNSPFKRTVVFLDETWIFAKGNRKRSWQDGSVKGTRKPGGFEGKRCIVLHAGHSGGFVENASLIYGTASKLADYHGDMNGDISLKWVKEKLVPNLEEPCLIVMDNASYHSVLVEKQQYHLGQKPRSYSGWRETTLILRGTNLKVSS